MVKTVKNKNFVNYAHRGASSYSPENTIMAFDKGIEMGANGIETDVQATSDGYLVLFHDDTITRMTGESGSIGDYTYAELSNFWVKKDGEQDKIPTFDEFLSRYSKCDLTFAIEIKHTGIEKGVCDAIKKYDIVDKVVVTSFCLDSIKIVKEYMPSIRVGYLTSRLDEALADLLLSFGAYEYCPKAEGLTAELVEYYHNKGLNVRAWGVSDEDIMQKAYFIGVDGMTVNFPDKLQALLDQAKTV